MKLFDADRRRQMREADAAAQKRIRAAMNAHWRKVGELEEEPV